MVKSQLRKLSQFNPAIFFAAIYSSVQGCADSGEKWFPFKRKAPPAEAIVKIAIAIEIPKQNLSQSK